MTLGQRGWIALAFGAARATLNLLGWALGKAYQRLPATLGGQPDKLTANRGGCDRISARRPLARPQLIPLFGLAAFVTASSPAGAQTTFSTLYSFQGSPDGASPQAGMVMDAAGNLYGTTYEGGANNGGMVFELTPNAAKTSWTETVLYSFCAQGGKNCTDGANPRPKEGLTIDTAGHLYGTTYAGGAYSGGTVFELTPNAVRTSWTETILYSFCATKTTRLYCGDGAYPVASVITDAAGHLYGTTYAGGTIDYGTVFELTPNAAKTTWTETVLYSFCAETGCFDGALPLGGVIMDAAGNLYGTTVMGGGYHGGEVFELTPNAAKTRWTETLLHSFCAQRDCVDGGYPEAGLIMDATGHLYGTTENGGTGINDAYGTVFELTPNAAETTWTETVLDSFCGYDSCTDGSFPTAGLIMDAGGHLYGTTNGGGADGYGMVFELTPNAAKTTWTKTVLHSFTDGSDGGRPGAGLILDASGALYGTTASGGDLSCGSGSGCGTVFQLSGAGTPLSENPQTSDFNADGKSDILLQNATSGEMWMWEMNGINVISSGSPGSPAPSWQVIATGDFYGSLYSDILLQNTSGELWIWEMNGTKVIGGGSPGDPGPSWHAIGTGDFNGDGYSDILLQNTTGAVEIWEMNGLKVIGKGSPGSPASSWHVVGSGDFNGDGYSDILLQNTSGELWIWEMNGTKVIAGGSPGDPGPSWHAIGTGDLNGDGKSDILLQNTSGAVEIWEMNGLKVIGKGSPGSPTSSWHVIGSGDFNGDGYSDILLQNTSGELWIWEMNGTKVIAGGSPGDPGPSWHAIGE